MQTIAEEDWEDATIVAGDYTWYGTEVVQEHVMKGSSGGVVEKATAKMNLDSNDLDPRAPEGPKDFQDYEALEPRYGDWFTRAAWGGASTRTRLDYMVKGIDAQRYTAIRAGERGMIPMNHEFLLAALESGDREGQPDTSSEVRHLRRWACPGPAIPQIGRRRRARDRPAASSGHMDDGFPPGVRSPNREARVRRGGRRQPAPPALPCQWSSTG